MSHLAHTVKLKSALLEAGVADLKLQEQVINAAYINAITKYLFSRSLVFGAYNEEVEEQVSARLNRWNNISPINGQYILEGIRQLFPALTEQAMNLGSFKPYPNLVVEGYDYRQCPVYLGLVNWLYGEMVNNND